MNDELKRFMPLFCCAIVWELPPIKSDDARTVYVCREDGGFRW